MFAYTDFMHIEMQDNYIITEILQQHQHPTKSTSIPRSVFNNLSYEKHMSLVSLILAAAATPSCSQHAVIKLISGKPCLTHHFYE